MSNITFAEFSVNEAHILSGVQFSQEYSGMSTFSSLPTENTIVNFQQEDSNVAPIENNIVINSQSQAEAEAEVEEVIGPTSILNKILFSLPRTNQPIIITPEINQKYFPIVNKATYENIENAFCDICLFAYSSENDQLVVCDLCHSAAHQDCYREEIRVDLPKDEWLCARCSYLLTNELEYDKITCHLCPHFNGIMKKVNNLIWMHLDCIQFTPGIWFEDEDLTKVNLTNLDPKIFNYKCNICKQKKGGCIKCDFRSCKETFHVKCAKKQQLIQDWETNEEFVVNDFFPVFCKTHWRRVKTMKTEKYQKLFKGCSGEHNSNNFKDLFENKTTNDSDVCYCYNSAKKRKFKKYGNSSKNSSMMIDLTKEPINVTEIVQDNLTWEIVIDDDHPFNSSHSWNEDNYDILLPSCIASQDPQNSNLPNSLAIDTIQNQEEPQTPNEIDKTGYNEVILNFDFVSCLSPARINYVFKVEK